MTLNKKYISKMIFNIKTVYIKKVSIIDLIVTLSINTFSIVSLSTSIQRRNAECYYAECCIFLFLCCVILCWMLLCWVSLVKCYWQWLLPWLLGTSGTEKTVQCNVSKFMMPLKSICNKNFCLNDILGTLKEGQNNKHSF